MRYYSNSRELINLPSFTFPVQVKLNHRGQVLPVPETKYLSEKFLRMLDASPTAWEHIKSKPVLTDITKEYDSNYQAGFLFHTETQEQVELNSFSQRKYLNYNFPLYGDNPSPLLNHTNVTISLHIEPADFIDSSVHPKWGRKYEIFSDNLTQGRGATNEIAEIPKLPSHNKLETTSPAKIISFKEWEYIDLNTPEPPTINFVDKQITYKDLTPDRVRTLEDIINGSYSFGRGAYFIADRDELKNYLATKLGHDGLPAGRVWEKVQVRAGDIYEVFYTSNYHIYCQRVRRYDGKNADGAPNITISASDNFFSAVYVKKTTDTEYFANNFIIKQDLRNEAVYNHPSLRLQNFEHLNRKYFKVKNPINDNLNTGKLNAGDYVKITNIYIRDLGTRRHITLNYIDKYPEELEYWKEQYSYSYDGQRGKPFTLPQTTLTSSQLYFEYLREEEGTRPTDYTPQIAGRVYMDDYTAFFHHFEPYEYSRTYTPPVAPKEFAYLGEPLTKAFATLSTNSYRASTQVLGADRVNPESLQELLLDTSIIANKEQDLFFRLSEQVGNYPAGQYFRVIGNGSISVPSGQSPYLLDSEGNIIMEEYTSEAGTQRLTRPVPNPDYIATYNIDTALVIPTGSTNRPVELQLYYYNQKTFLYDREQLENFNITGKFNSSLFEIISPAVDDMVLNKYYSGVNTNPNGYFIRFGEDAIHTSDTANADLAEQNKFIVAKQDFRNFKAGRVYKMQRFRSEQVQLGSGIFDHYGEFYEMAGDIIAGDKFTIDVTDSDLLRVFYPITYAKISS